MEEQKTKRCVWRDEFTWKLIELWRINVNEMKRSKRNKIVYDNMSRELNNMGLNIGVEEIRNKIKNLSKKFREELMLVQNPEGNYTSDWKFYNSIHKILGHRSHRYDYNNYNNHHQDSLAELQSKSWLTIVSEPDLSLVKHETNPGSDDGSDYMENSEPNPDYFTPAIQIDSPPPPDVTLSRINKTHTSTTVSSQYNNRDNHDSVVNNVNDPLDGSDQSDSDHSKIHPISSSLENTKRKNRQLKRKYEIHKEILAEIKRSNQIAEKNDQMSLLLAAEANKLLEKSNQIQEQLLDLLSNRL